MGDFTADHESPLLDFDQALCTFIEPGAPPRAGLDVRLVLWDWDGVLGLQHYWQRPSVAKDAFDRFQRFAFRDVRRVDAWMRGQVSTECLAEQCGVDLSVELLASQLYEGWPDEALVNLPLFATVRQIFPSAVHVVVTDNIDVFSFFARGSPWMRGNLAAVVNSCDHGRLKADRPSLFETALATAGLVGGAQHAVLLDDSETNCAVFEGLGGWAIRVPRSRRQALTDSSL